MEGGVDIGFRLGAIQLYILNEVTLPRVVLLYLDLDLCHINSVLLWTLLLQVLAIRKTLDFDLFSGFALCVFTRQLPLVFAS